VGVNLNITPHPNPLPQGEREDRGKILTGTPHPSPLPQGEREDRREDRGKRF